VSTRLNVSWKFFDLSDSPDMLVFCERLSVMKLRRDHS